MNQLGYPPWVILHIPHDSSVIPSEVRSQFLLSDAELKLELQHMTDHFTHALFAEPHGDATVVRAPVSRLVIDVERFPDDTAEPMASRGMGAIYEVTSHLAPLRRKLSSMERETLMLTWYHSHHNRLEAAVSNAVEMYGRCLVIDCHSFPGTALPYENANPEVERPDICIGSDPYHTSGTLEQAFVSTFSRDGWRVAVNDPFAGALVPASRYRVDPRVTAVMVEVNRDLYLDCNNFQPSSDFDRIAVAIKDYCVNALAKWSAEYSNTCGDLLASR